MALLAEKTDRRHVSWPLAEMSVIPLAGVLAAFGLVFAYTRAIALCVGLAIGPTCYLAVLFGALAGGLATLLGALFRQPVWLRGLDLAMALVAAEAGVRANGPVPMANFRFIRIVHPVSAEALIPLAVFAAWLLSSYLTTVVFYLYPGMLPKAKDREIQAQLHEEWIDRAHYVRDRVGRAGDLARRRVYDIMLLLYTIFFTLMIIGRTSQIAGDLPLTWGVTAVAAGMLGYMAVVELAAKRRLAELDAEVVTCAKYSLAWGLGAFLPAVVAIVIALLLPSNFNPLGSLHWQGSIDGAGAWAYRQFLKTFDPAALPPSGGPLTPPGRGIGPQPLLQIGMWLVFLFGLYYTIHELRHLPANKRSDRLWLLLLAIILWPFVTFFRWLRGSAAKLNVIKRNPASKPAMSGTQQQSSRLKRLLLDPAEYVRYAYGRMLREAASHGMRRRQSETAGEFAGRLASLLPENHTESGELTELYCSTKYAMRPPGDAGKKLAMSLLRRVVGAMRRMRA